MVAHSFRANDDLFLNNIRETHHCLLDLGIDLRLRYLVTYSQRCCSSGFSFDCFRGSGGQTCSQILELIEVNSRGKSTGLRQIACTQVKPGDPRLNAIQANGTNSVFRFGNIADPLSSPIASSVPACSQRRRPTLLEHGFRQS
jgi:hypothetical protein